MRPVAIRPGTSMFTVMPCDATSRASVFDQPTNALRSEFERPRFGIGAITPDEALVITGRWPTCAFANVALWNRYLQTFDYAHRPVSRNRANTVLEPDGSFRMVIAHEDPGVDNWIDTEGRPFGMVFWRFFLAEGEIETPQATVVQAEDLR